MIQETEVKHMGMLILELSLLPNTKMLTLYYKNNAVRRIQKWLVIFRNHLSIYENNTKKTDIGKRAIFLYSILPLMCRFW